VSDIEKRPDLYIGLVGASGTNLDPVLRQIRAQLAGFHYKCTEIKVSKLISDFLSIPTTGLPEDKRIVALMDGGDRLRNFMAKGDAVAYLVVKEIERIRLEHHAIEGVLCGNTAFVINSLKNPYEIELLDDIYGRNFYSVSVYSDEIERQELLAAKIAASEGVPVEKSHRDRALDIMQQDEKRSNDDYSQNVEDTFPKADFFAPSKTDVARQIERFFDLVFGAPFITPTRGEYGMYIANIARVQTRSEPEGDGGGEVDG
jgi:cytidine deaminase